MNTERKTFEDLGRVWFRNALSELDLNTLISLVKMSERAGQRIIWAEELDKVLGANSDFMKMAQALLPDCKPVRIIAFNKTEEMNWSLPWHQDRVIAVKSKSTSEGFKNWTRKDGVLHCEPPVQILENMMFARIHLDDTDAQNGAMQIAHESHKAGYIAASEIAAVANNCKVETCEAKRGDIIFVKALTLHRSGSSKSATPRRALRIDFSNQKQPRNLEWDLRI